MPSTWTTLAVLGLATLGQAHMMMHTPVPMGLAVLNNSPLNGDGSDFPCKLTPGSYDVTTVNTIALGSVQPLTFTGSATHGGGSCQISITYDANPTKDSVFKAIYSIEGGCPAMGVTGNLDGGANQADPYTYNFTVPTNIPTGNATLAWTWFNKVGNREMYMNCAAISLTGSSTKRDEPELVERDQAAQAAFNALPDMFVANVDNGCTTGQNADVLFPNPGEYRVNLAGATANVTSAMVTPSCTGSIATASLASTMAVSGGVFVTVSTSSTAMITAAPVASSAAASSPSAVVSPVASSVTSSAAASSPSAVVSPVASSVASSAAPVSTGTTGTGTVIAAGTACTTEGEWNCIGGTSFQECASGEWSVAQPVAAGTTCTSGQTMNINISKKRALRFFA